MSIGRNQHQRAKSVPKKGSPSCWELVAHILTWLPLGALLAVGTLVFKPVEIAKEPPMSLARVKGQVYYIPGSRDRTKGVQWMMKRQRLFEGDQGVVTFNEDELNIWFAWEPTGVPVADGKGRHEWVEVKGIDFRIADDTLQVGFPVEIGMGDRRNPIMIQSSGGFAPKGGVVMYKPEEIWIGSMPLHRIPCAVDLLMNRLLSENAISGMALERWKNIRQVTITGREMQVEIQ